jgi:UDP-glucose 4-epimerase
MRALSVRGATEASLAAATSTSPWAGRKVLISGGLSFIGSNLAHRLAALGAGLVLVDSLVPQHGCNPHNVAGLEGRARINVSDIRDPYSLRYLVEGRKIILNLTGQTPHLDSIHDPFTGLDINCTAQLRLLEVCRHHNPGVKIGFASPRPGRSKASRTTCRWTSSTFQAPTGVNGINKMGGEWYHILYNNVYGLRTTALRLTNTYDPRMRIKDARQTFLDVWIKAVLEDKAL